MTNELLPEDAEWMNAALGPIEEEVTRSYDIGLFKLDLDGVKQIEVPLDAVYEGVTTINGDPYAVFFVRSQTAEEIAESEERKAFYKARRGQG